jgi:putative PIN family toxin of toxin-antitoxin system
VVINAIIGNIMKIRVLLDTNILVAGFASQAGASHQLLRFALDRQFVFLATPALWLEYEAVLKRPEMIELHGFSSMQVDDILHGLAACVEPVTSHFLWRPQLRDPNDEMVLEAAVNGSAQYLVTVNTRDLTVASDRFGIKVCLPGYFLKILEKAL